MMHSKSGDDLAHQKVDFAPQKLAVACEKLRDMHLNSGEDSAPRRKVDSAASTDTNSSLSSNGIFDYQILTSDFV